jgi:hypothetical protein
VLQRRRGPLADRLALPLPDQRAQIDDLGAPTTPT